MEKQNLAKVNTVNGRHFMEISLPHAFVAFPVTEQGINQMIEDLQEAKARIQEEEDILSQSVN